MLVLKFVFKYLSVLGMWSPNSYDNSKSKKILYKIYQLIISIIYLSMLSFLMYFLFKQLTRQNSKFVDYFEELFLLPVQLITYLKFAFVTVRRQKIIKLADYFLQVEFKPLNEFEVDQVKKYAFFMK